MLGLSPGDRGGNRGTERSSDLPSRAQPGGRSEPCTLCVCVCGGGPGGGALPADTLPRPPQDYGAALRGLCEDALEGLLLLLLFSLLSAGALATALCSLPRAWALFPPRSGGEGAWSREWWWGDDPWAAAGVGGQPPHGAPILPLCHSVTTMMTQTMTTLSTLR